MEIVDSYNQADNNEETRKVVGVYVCIYKNKCIYLLIKKFTQQKSTSYLHKSSI